MKIENFFYEVKVYKISGKFEEKNISSKSFLFLKYTYYEIVTLCNSYSSIIFML